MSSLWVTSLWDQQMIDRWIYNFFSGLDRMCESIAKCMESKPKKKKKK